MPASLDKDRFDNYPSCRTSLAACHGPVANQPISKVVEGIERAAASLLQPAPVERPPKAAIPSPNLWLKGPDRNVKRPLSTEAGYIQTDSKARTAADQV